MFLRSQLQPKACLLLLLSIFLLTFMSGCIPGKTPIQTGTGTPQATSPLPAAQAALQSGNFKDAKQLAEAFINSGSIPQADAVAAFKVLAEANAGSGQGADALKNLEQLRVMEAGIDKKDWWNSTLTTALENMPVAESGTYAKALSLDPARAWRPRAEAALFLLERATRGTNAAAKLPDYARLYSSASTIEQRKMLEGRMFNFMNFTDNQTLNSLTKAVNSDNENSFPYAVIALENARRLYLDPRTQDLALEKVTFLKEESQLADKDLFTRWNKADMNLLANVDVKTANIVLLLPMQDPYGNLSDKIVRGAKIACDALARDGRHISLHVIDTDHEGWLAKVAALPPGMPIVGGPLRLSDYTDLKNAGLLPSRFFFGFLPRLPEGDEGRDAWRFFASKEDQLQSLLDFSKDLGVSKYGALVPDEPYGEGMLTQFASQVEGMSAELLDSAKYPPAEYKEWNKVVAAYLKTNKNVDHEPATPFQALFMPDTWRNSFLMIPNLFYYRENRLLIMGTNLWEQALSAPQTLDARHYYLTVFPGSWNPDTTSKAGMVVRAAVPGKGKNKADFWTSLGFDFVSMASRLPVEQGNSAKQVNVALQRLHDVEWSGAPFTWDGAGQATQHLFIFTPNDTGFMLADKAKMRQLMKRYWGAKVN